MHNVYAASKISMFGIAAELRFVPYLYMKITHVVFYSDTIILIILCGSGFETAQRKKLKNK